MKKALFIFALCLLLITGCVQQPVSGISVTSSANSEATSSSSVSTPVLKEGDYDYKFEDGSVTIVKYNGTAENVVIPDMIAGFPVKVIGEDAFRENEVIKNVVISDNVILIDTHAYNKCKRLESVKFGQSIEEIGEGSFSVCWNLKQVTVNKKLKVIGEWAFSDCDSLETLDLPDSVESIGAEAFGQSGIKEFRFPNKIKEINTGTFSTSDLEKVTLPENVEVIGGAFAQTGITEVFIPDSVKSIGDGAFYDCPRELVLLYDNNPLVPKFAEEHNIVCVKRSEYNPVLTVELVNGKPLNDDKNQGISQEDYNLVKRRNKTDAYLSMFDVYVSNEYITFWDDEELTDDAVKAKLAKTATLLYQCGITSYNPVDIQKAATDYFDKMATFTIYSRSKEEIDDEDEKGLTGVLFADDRKFYANYEIFFGLKPDMSKFSGYSQQQKGIWYYPKEFPKVLTEVLSFSGNAEKMEYSLKLRFTPESGSPIEKTFSYKLTEEGTVGGDHHRITLTGIQ